MSPEEIDDRYVVAIGKKDIMSYVRASLSCLHRDNGYAVIKARGRFISKAVDLVMLLKRNFIKDLKIREIKIGTEHLPSPNGRLVAKSWITIYVEKPRRSEG